MGLIYFGRKWVKDEFQVYNCRQGAVVAWKLIVEVGWWSWQRGGERDGEEEGVLFFFVLFFIY